ncbi:hypothetical protein HYDPIDRAFT_27325 [Hydnomerulius pinastri MD-312]|nr:hypothetical protein HYDPIDRAFT_27325 [Hydnomerulius pinastri MD-312]
MDSRAYTFDSSSSFAYGDNQPFGYIEDHVSCDYMQEGIDPYQSSSSAPYYVDLLCQSPTLETCFENLHLSRQADRAPTLDIPGPAVPSPASTPTLPPAQEAGTSVFPRDIEEILGWLAQQKPDIMHGLPASVPTSAPDQQGRPTSQSPRAVPVPEKILPIARNITSYPDIRISDPDHVSKRIMHSCKWRRDDGSLCRGNISWTTCSDHLAVHGIEDMPSMLKITCGWCDKTVKRESIVRHVREKHLGVKRVVKHLGVKHAVKPPPREDRAPSPGRT